ncbi:GTP 3',8-cyclase MoaA, partial [bacterium]|nr:GTP 3',8-cyclase MoaA [bacterium]
SHFCDDCNRLRLTSRGTLRPCLLNNYEKDILNPLRNSASDDDLKKIILSTLTKKPSFHKLNDLKPSDIPINHMTSIGG